jgi:hypothetical protein
MKRNYPLMKANANKFSKTTKDLFGEYFFKETEVENNLLETGSESIASN